MTKRTIYLSGPMTGYPDHNYPLFNRVAAELRALGHYVFNPAEYPHDGPPDAFPLREAFAAYCSFICLSADMVMLLPGWQESSGAQAEQMLASRLGIDCLEYIDMGEAGVRRGTSMTDSMVERVARAIYEVSPLRAKDGPYEDQPEAMRRVCRKFAEVAVEEMLDASALLKNGRP